ncbi:PiggyBac transposable element-derived protein 4 [Cucumispora dikerogammari]|nr:PiggyBac transposable element-derived protein 4 [Cucumispora dikerogammari]
MVSIDEIKKYIAIVLFLGIVKQLNIKDYWLKNTSIYGIDFVQSLMGYDRFTLIDKNLSLASIERNNICVRSVVASDTSKIIEYLNSTFKYLYTPSQVICINEAMCKYQERYNFKTYMPAKLIKEGIKFYILAESATSFVLKFKLYTGSYNPIKETVKNLLVDVKPLNHTLYMNNYYNSFELCENLR